MIILTLEQAQLKGEVETYLEFVKMHWEVTETQLERDLQQLYHLHGMLVPPEKVRELAEGLTAHREWQEDVHDGSTEDECKWWREGREASKALPDPDPSTHCTSRALWPGS
jgi:hypothetical protein